MAKFVRKLILTTLVAFLIYSLSKNIFNYQKKFVFFEDYKKGLQKELEKNKKLKSEILKSQDYHVIEKNIRQKLNLIKPNEIAIILPKITPTPSLTPIIKKPPYQQWLELFF